MAKALGTIERLWYFTLEGDDESVFGWEAPEFEKHLHTPIGEWVGDVSDKAIEIIEGVLNQTQAQLVCDEDLSVEEALTAVVAKLPEPEEPWDGVAR